MNCPRHGGNLVWAATLAGCPPESILDFSASINPLGPPETAIAAIQAHLKTLTHYPDPSYQSLCQVLSEVHRLPLDWFIPGNGSAELLTWACRDLAQCAWTGILTPAFADYARALQSFDAQVRPYPINLVEQFSGNTLSLAKVLATAELTSIKVSQAPSLLLNHPHNPTGQLLALKQVESCLEQFSLVVVDEAFIDFLPPGDQQSMIPWVMEHPNLVVLRSLTKFYSLPGLRLGYAVGHPERLARWRQWRDPWCVNSLAVAAGIAALQDHSFQQQTWDWLTSARTQLSAGIAELPGLHPFPSLANFLLIAADYPVPSLQTALLKEHQIFIRDCLSFPELGAGYFRVAVRTASENQRLLAALADCLPSLSTSTRILEA
ncbi:MAG: threonine-phosphate decarboxylase [Acaryochloridaceae cyanobacterium CSU_5_19]|nr:threonine-phosphate decarboxylase [Acaryochloridaceae cyanobacterium CSU_5_19]